MQAKDKSMPVQCPRCGRAVEDDFVYCPYCAHGLKPTSKTERVSTAGVLMLVATVGSLVFLVLSVQALLGIYKWYPQFIAQSWFIYDQLLTALFTIQLSFGVSASILSLLRRKHSFFLVSATICTASGGFAWIVSLIMPGSVLWESMLYYFLPMFFAPPIATALTYPRKAEFKK
jgi:hypothetical protein